MRLYEYKCQRCEEKHREAVPLNELEDTYFKPCPCCGFVSRRVPVRLSTASSDDATETRVLAGELQVS